MKELERMERLERKMRVMFLMFVAVVMAVVVVSVKAQSGARDVLRVRRLTIVDENGTDRIVLGAPLPDPVVNGRSVKRSGAVSGLAVLDAKGNERAGFATADSSGEVFIGLDSETGQEVLFLANPKGGSHLSIFDSNRNLVRIGVLEGKPTLLVRQKGETIFEQPEAR
jgi:hypothetical protein